MRTRTQKAKTRGQRNHSFAVGPDPHAHNNPEAAYREGLALGATVARTMAHFWPEMGHRLGRITDTRDQCRIPRSSD